MKAWPQLDPARDPVLSFVKRALAYAGVAAISGGIAFVGYEGVGAFDGMLYTPIAVLSGAAMLVAFGALFASFCTLYEWIYNNWRSLSQAASLPIFLLIAVPLLAVGAISMVALGSLAVGAAIVTVALWPLLIVVLLVLILAKK